MGEVQTSQANDPLPCPFCGEPVEIETWHYQTAPCQRFIRCCNLGCEVSSETNTFDTDAEAVAAWNTRALNVISLKEVLQKAAESPIAANICMSWDTFERIRMALVFADEVLKTTRFAALDQNPKGVRDLVGSARLVVDGMVRQ